MRVGGAAETGLKRCAAEVGIFTQPGSQPALDQVLALLGKPAKEVLPHDLLGSLIEFEHQTHPREDLRIANRLHILIILLRFPHAPPDLR